MRRAVFHVQLLSDPPDDVLAPRPPVGRSTRMLAAERPGGGYSQGYARNVQQSL
jgi:hypothetical protein